MFNLKTAKWQLPLLLASVLAFSVPAHASKVKALVGLGNLHELFSTAAVDVDAQGDTEGSIGYGFTLDFTFGGSGALAIDYYVAGDTTDTFGANGDQARILSGSLPPGAPAIPAGTAIEGAISGSGILIGGRWHADNGFYIGGGALGSTAEFVYKVGGNTVGNYKADRKWAAALTLGYDYTFSNGLALGVHAMRSLPVDINLDLSTTVPTGPGVPPGTPSPKEAANTIAGGDFEKGFYMQSINFGIGYDW